MSHSIASDSIASRDVAPASFLLDLVSASCVGARAGGVASNRIFSACICVSVVQNDQAGRGRHYLIEPWARDVADDDALTGKAIAGAKRRAISGHQ